MPKVNYREYAAKGVIEALRKLGICLVTAGPHLRAVPQPRLRKYPGMVFMIDRYRPEIKRLLDDEVE
jgi:hypothetical protein